MHPCSEDSFEWIRTGREQLPPRDQGDWKCLVANLIPKQFEAYAKVLHQIDANYENIDNPLTESEQLILKIPKCIKLRSFVEGLRYSGRGPRIRWRELAQLYALPFEAEICHKWFFRADPVCLPRFLFGPGDGSLNAQELSAFLSVLQPFANNQDFFIRFSEIPFIAGDQDEPLHFCGLFEELSTFLADEKYQFTPEYWWPADHSWCVCSDYDLTFTIVAGSKDLVSVLLNNTTLEAIQVTPQTRVDSNAPVPK
jgi:hypothetical protein